MADPKPSLTIFVQNKIGGVQFFYSNLVRTGAFGAFDARYLATEYAGDPDAKLPEPLEGAPMEVCRHTATENYARALRRLAGRLPAAPGLVLTNLLYELACLDVHRRPDLTVLHFCHDENYVDIARRHAQAIDGFIAHNPFFAERLRAVLPPERAGDVHFLPFGIRQDPAARRAPNPAGPLRVVFIGRLHALKGVLELPRVDDLLRVQGIRVEWLILGRGPEGDSLARAVAGRDNFMLESPPDGAAMLRRAAWGDVFVLPSRLDGTPLAVMEAMSVGLVPVVSEFNPGARWMVPPEAGFICPPQPGDIAETLARLHGDRAELETRSAASLAHARAEFEVERKARDYAAFFARWRELKRAPSGPPARYGSLLDRPWVPDAVVAAYRYVKRWRERRRRDARQG